MRGVGLESEIGISANHLCDLGKPLDLRLCICDTQELRGALSSSLVVLWF